MSRVAPGLRFVTTVGGSRAACGELLVMGSPRRRPKLDFVQLLLARLRAGKRYDSGWVRERWRDPQGRGNEFWFRASVV